MRSKKEILGELQRDDERSRERERPSLEGLVLEVLIDIRDAIISLSNKSKISAPILHEGLSDVTTKKTSDHPELVEVKSKASES